MKRVGVRMMKRLLSSGLVAALVISMLGLSACGKDKMTAIAMRLFYAEGTVGLTDEAGSDKSLVENMNFYTGYHLQTGDDGQAKVSLDETRLVTLASESLLGFEKKGEAMKLSLEEGELFFNVEEKLPESASLEIETSTMVVGIRGTSGIVKNEVAKIGVMSAKITTVTITDGEVETAVKDETGATVDTVKVGGGESLTVTTTQDETGKTSVDYQKTQTDATSLPPLAMVEIQGSSDLAARVADAYNMETGELLKVADEVLEKENGDKNKKDSAEKKSDTDKKPADETGGGANKTTDDDETADGNGTRNTQNRGNANRQANRGGNTINGMTPEQLEEANRQLALEEAAAQAQAQKEAEEKARREEEKKKQEEAPAAEPAAAPAPSGPISRQVSAFFGGHIIYENGVYRTDGDSGIYENVTKIGDTAYRGNTTHLIYTQAAPNADGSQDLANVLLTVYYADDGVTPSYIIDYNGAKQYFTAENEQVVTLVQIEEASATITVYAFYNPENNGFVVQAPN